jgi:hypothetical protein
VADDISTSTPYETLATWLPQVSDVDGDIPTCTADSVSLNGGSVTVASDCSSGTYDPPPGFVGTDSFGYSVSDGNGGSDTAIVTITVTDVNNPPVANDQGVITDEDTAVSITLTASDPDNDPNDPLTYSVVTGPANGTLSGVAPSLTYTPDPDYNGSDSFTFKANDGELDSNIATVSITVTAVNDAPLADNQSVTTDEDTPLAITLTGSDIDSGSLTYSIVSIPSYGTLSGTPPNLTYTPSADFNGADSFTFKINDGELDSNIASVSITVTAVNDAPVADNQSKTTSEDTPVAITLSGSDVDGDDISFALLTLPAFGSLSGTMPDLIYTPNPDFNGSDSFTYNATDGQSNSNIATVSLTVSAVNDDPIAYDQDVTTDEDTPVNFVLSL